MRLETEKSADYINKVISFRRDVFDKIANKNPKQIWLKTSLNEIKNVVIINSASRSGSSLLFAILKNIPNVYSSSGESTPFYKLNKLSFGVFLSDEIPEEFKGVDTCLSGISRDFLSDFSIASSQNNIFADNKLLDRYIDDLALRFSLQWPQVDFSYNVFRRLAGQAFDIYSRSYQKFFKELFYLELLWFLRCEYKTINPYYYDIPAEMVKKRFPALLVPSAPPDSVLTIEEPPFILLSPERKVDSRDLADKILLLKSSVDCYKMHFIETLFPCADIKIIYLTRNPAASINGLCDGWLHRGFFSHNLKPFLDKNTRGLGQEILKISGYSDRYEWGKWWWNYDLPPGWQNYMHSKLEEVCAFQWYSANMAIQKYLNKSQKQYCLINYEYIIKSSESRTIEIDKIKNFIGIKGCIAKLLTQDNLPIVQATEIPQLYRWKKRKDALFSILNSPKISEMSSRLGYNKDNIKEWF